MSSLYIGGIDSGLIRPLGTAGREKAARGVLPWAPVVRGRAVVVGAGRVLRWLWGCGVVAALQAIGSLGRGADLPGAAGAAWRFCPGRAQNRPDGFFCHSAAGMTRRQRPTGGKCEHICMDFLPCQCGRPFYQGLQAVKPTTAQAAGRLRLDSGGVRRSDDEDDCDQ